MCLLRRRDEARAGVVRLVAHRAIQLRGMSDGLVDREPEILRIEDEVVAARLDRLARSASRRRAAPTSRRCPACRATRCTPSRRRAARAPRCTAGSRPAPTAVAENDGPTRTNVCVVSRAFGVRVRLHLAQQLQPRVHEANALHLERRFVRREQQRDLLLDRHLERIARDRRHPRAFDDGRRRELDGPLLHRLRGARRAARPRARP